MRWWGRGGLVPGVLLTVALARPGLVSAQEVIPGGPRPLVTPDVAPDHWVMEAARRAEALGLLDRPLPFRRSISLEQAARVVEEAWEAARGRGAGLEALTEGWRERLYREFGGLAAGGEPGAIRLLGVRGRGGVVTRNGAVAPGVGEVGSGRTGAVPLEDEASAVVEGEVVAGFGERFGLLIEPRVSSERGQLRRLDLVAGADNWKIAAGRQPLGLAKSSAAGLVLSGAVPIDRVEVRTERPAVLPGELSLLGPVGFQLFAGRLWNDDRHRRKPFFWGGSLSVQPWPRVGLAVHRAVMFGGRGYDAPATLKTFVDMLIGRVANLGFENQIVSVEARYRLPTEGWVPLTAYLEWGAEDAAGGWWDVPGRVIGVETPAVPGLEALAAGAAFTSIAEQCCGNSPWYRHGAFRGSWAAKDRPLGHALGGEGREWLLYGTLDRPEREYWLEGRLFRRNREGQNLFVPGREESHGLALQGSWRERPGLEIEAEVEVEAGSEWSEQNFGVGVNLYF